MRFGSREVCLDHDTGPQHPERPARLRAIRSALAERETGDYHAPPDVDESLLRSVHDPAYVDAIREFCADGGGHWNADTVAGPATWDAALASAGLAVWVAEAAIQTDVGPGTPFSLGRPPGHHATADDAMGFCFFNNVVVAAESVLGNGADRVAVVDWDVHHGNGTQDLCFDRGDVFYASIHQSPLYPGTGQLAETGAGEGAMTTCNAPVPPGSDTADYLAVFDEVFLPSIRAYDPDLVLVSAGFDAHVDDAISSTRLTASGFGLLAARVRAFAEECNAGIGFVLEGGYALDALADSVVAVADAVDGSGAPAEAERSLGDGEVSEGVRRVVDDLRAQGFGEE